MLRNHVFYGNIAPGHSCRAHKRAGLDLIRNDGIIGPVQSSDTADTDDIRTGSLDIGSHAV